MEMKKYRLDEIATVEISGVDKKTKDNEIPVRLCNFTDVYHNWAITKEMTDSFMKASANQKEINTLSLKKGQVAFTKDSETRDDIGIPTYIADDFENVVLGYHTALITPDKSKLSGKYLNAFMNTRYIKKYFENNASGSGQRYTLSNETLNAIPIIAPDLTTQKKIGDVFSNIDKKIALNRRMNAKLEQMAKRLYDYWFVQFDFPRSVSAEPCLHELCRTDDGKPRSDFPNADGKPYKASGGKMEYNEVLKREIPAGWEVGNLYDIANITMGQSPEGSSYNEIGEGTVFYQGSTDFGIRFPTIRMYTTSPTRYAKQGDILISVRAPVGAMNVANTDCCIGRGLATLNSKIGSITHLWYLMDVFKHTFENKNAAGTTFGSITKDELYNLPVVIPQKEIIFAFNEKTFSIFNYQLSIEKETQHLTTLRDRLLPLLMNGQVEVN